MRNTSPTARANIALSIRQAEPSWRATAIAIRARCLERLAANFAVAQSASALLKRTEHFCYRNCATGSAPEGEELVAGFLQAVGHGAVLEPPRAGEARAARVDFPQAWPRRSL